MLGWAGRGPLRGVGKLFATKSLTGRSALLHAPLFAMLAGGFSTAAQAALQCVPYAREVSGIDIHGNARTWWDQADSQYKRGRQPEVGAVLTFRPTSAMPMGHVAVVSKVVDDRTIILDHANWSRPGLIERHAMAVDVSPAGDWSEVRVWYAPIGALGTRSNPTFGFIYNEAPGANGPLLAGDANGQDDQIANSPGDSDAAQMLSVSIPVVQQVPAEADRAGA